MCSYVFIAAIVDSGVVAIASSINNISLYIQTSSSLCGNHLNISKLVLSQFISLESIQGEQNLSFFICFKIVNIQTIFNLL
ncbi:hypothetical protein GW891_00205 [bacterium]|nr:hypothetical protein [bacterium]